MRLRSSHHLFSFFSVFSSHIIVSLSITLLDYLTHLSLSTLASSMMDRFFRWMVQMIPDTQISEEVGCVRNLKRNVDDLMEEAQKLKAHCDDIEIEGREASRKRMRLTNQADTWVDQAKANLTEIENIKSEFDRRQTSGNGFFSYLTSTYALGKRAVTKLERVRRHLNERSGIQLLPMSPPRMVMEMDVPTVGQSSSQRNMDKIWDLFHDKHTSVIISVESKIEIGSKRTAGSPRRLSPNSRLHSSLLSSRKAFIREELERATNGFSESNFLGKGGFGVLEDGRQVAVKQHTAGSAQGDSEFQAEVEIVSRVHHRHLVSLVGYCIAEGEQMLVYEFVPNNTLKFHLHGRGELTLDWPTRLKIAWGSARGLAYLHEDCQPKIIHRDIKADNILLDHNYEAKIADFGLARIFPDDQTHVEATLAGTMGYLDPEYACSGQLTDKSDVYAFGVILLELVTGFPPIFKTIGSTKSNRLVHWASNRNYQGLVDPRLKMNYDAEELARVVECAAACVRLPSHSRPRMIEVARVLEASLSVDCLRRGLTGISRTRSGMDYNPNRHSVTSSITHSLTLDPSRLDRGTELTGSIVYHSTIVHHSTMSSQDQGGNGNGIPSSPINNYHV